jgi:DNA-directed RNA polymerase specialized sigma24 family protein
MAQALIDWTVRNRDVLFEQIVRALDQMPADLREVFVLTHYEGKSPWEIAERMHVSTVEINDRISRANDVFFRTLGGADGY